jgi:7-cyano-7-deazaguanine synthase
MSATESRSRAVVLLSGGLDSATALAIARSEGRRCHALTVAYGQLHAAELGAAHRVASALGAEQHRVLELDLRPIAASALTSREIEVPKDRDEATIGSGEVPPTYVPARNTIFLGLALAWAETLGAREIFVGVNVLDASGYPDCTPDFVRSFEELARVATAAGAHPDRRIRIRAPLIDLKKAEIIRRGHELGLDYGLTHSCYEPADGDRACGRCDACVLRRRGFREAGLPDPTRYG